MGIDEENRRARDLVAEGRLDEADAIATAVLAAAPGSADAWAIRGYVAAKRGDFEGAAAFIATAVAGRREALWLGLLSDLHRNLYRLDEAERFAHEAIEAAGPRSRAGAFSALGRVLTERGDLAGAAGASLAILAASPEDPFAHFALAEALLGQGEWAAGWAEYEWRRQLPSSKRGMPDLGIAHWNGMRLPQGRLLVVCDQGFGDTMQFARYLPAAADRVGELRIACAPAMAGLLGRVPGVARVLSEWGDLPLDPAEWAAQVQISSLPFLLDPAGERIEAARYLRADPARAAFWAAHLETLRPGAARVGLAWAGKTTHANDRRRSIGLAALGPVVARRPDALFVSVQREKRAGDAALLEALGVFDAGEALDSFDETAALVAGLDLLVTIDSAPAHLAGAVGTEAWVLLPAPPDWRWGIGGERTRWYERMRLFRQARPGAWGAPVAEMAQALAALERARRTG